jgi:hypothetical protein
MRALHEGLLGKKTAANLTLYRRLTHLAYIACATFHYVLLVRTQDDFHNDYKQDYDPFMYAHMFNHLALTLFVSFDGRGSVEPGVHSHSGKMDGQPPVHQSTKSRRSTHGAYSPHENQIVQLSTLASAGASTTTSSLHSAL